MSVSVTVYRRDNCLLCIEAKRTIERVADDVEATVDVTTHDVDADPDLEAEYGERVPYVLVEGTPKFKYRVNEDAFREAIHAAME